MALAGGVRLPVALPYQCASWCSMTPRPRESSRPPGSVPHHTTPDSSLPPASSAQIDVMDGGAGLKLLATRIGDTASRAGHAPGLAEHGNALAGALQKRLQDAGAEVAHLKMTFSPAGGLNDIAVVNLVRSDFVPELSLRLDQPCTAGQLIVTIAAARDRHWPTSRRACTASMSSAGSRSAGVGAPGVNPESA